MDLKKNKYKTSQRRSYTKIRVIKGKRGCQNVKKKIKKKMWSREYNRFIYDLCDQHSKIFNQHIFKIYDFWRERRKSIENPKINSVKNNTDEIIVYIYRVNRI